MNNQQIQLLRQAPDPNQDHFLPFYLAVRHATNALGFSQFDKFVGAVFCPPGQSIAEGTRLQRTVTAATGLATGSTNAIQHFGFNGTSAYDQLAEATLLFIASQAALLEVCCTQAKVAESSKAADSELAKVQPTTMFPKGQPIDYFNPDCYDVSEINRRFAPHQLAEGRLNSLADLLFSEPGSTGGACCEAQPAAAAAAKAGTPSLKRLTYLQQVQANLPGLPVLSDCLGQGACNGLLMSKLTCPPMVELIWSYWMEQAMLVQGMNAVTLRYQNRLFPGSEGLRRFDVSPLRPMNSILWGYIQREPDRLTLARRSYEYDHQYGLRLHGQAVPAMHPADSRVRFLESFHQVLQEACRFYRIATDTTLAADAFPALNALRELHLVLAEGAHNQFGDLPSTARAEMLLQQWLLARPEVKDFLGGRTSVPYAEAWMPHMDSLRQLMGWNDASIRHYRDLATFGEQLLLSVRYLPWSLEHDSTLAAGWLTFWRPEIQGYVHAYRAVTGVDLSVVDQPVRAGSAWATQPSELIRSRRVGAAALTR
jgi:hypothetical protein